MWEGTDFRLSRQCYKRSHQLWTSLFCLQVRHLSSWTSEYRGWQSCLSSEVNAVPTFWESSSRPEEWGSTSLLREYAGNPKINLAKYFIIDLPSIDACSAVGIWTRSWSRCFWWWGPSSLLPIHLSTGSRPEAGAQNSGSHFRGTLRRSRRSCGGQHWGSSCLCSCLEFELLR